MRFRVFLQRAAISAGAVILAIGLAVAQTAPTPSPTPAPAPAPTAPNPPSATPGGDSGRGDWRAARDACRTQVDSAVRGEERREAMRKCMAERRGTGPQLTEAERGRNREMRGSDRKAMKETRETTYVDESAVRAEILHAQKIFERHRWPVIDVTRRSVEETAAAVLNLIADQKR